jgi:hypothetical protein
MKYTKPDLYSVSSVNADAQCASGSSPALDDTCGTGVGVYNIPACGVGSGNVYFCNLGNAAADSGCGGGGNPNQACAGGGVN